METYYLNSSGNAPASDILSVSSNEIINIKEDSDSTIFNIKKEKDEENFNNKIKGYDDEESKPDIHQNNIKQEINCELAQSSGEFPLFVNVEMNIVKKEEKLSEEIFEEQKQLLLQDSKCDTINILEHELESSVEIDNVSYLSFNEDNVGPSCNGSSDNKSKRSTKNRKTALVSGSKKCNYLLVRDKEDVNCPKTSSSKLIRLDNSHKGFKTNKANDRGSIPKPRNTKIYVNSLHQKKIYECLECHKIFQNLYRLKRHDNRVHKRIKNYQCHKCYKTFFEYTELRGHIEGIYKKNIKCEECQKIFVSARHLKRHIDSVHRGVKEYQCHECQKMFSYKTVLKRHIESVHKRIKNYACKECHTSFYLITGLKKHIDSVHKGIKNFVCSICYKKFSRANDLNTHMKGVHKRVRDQECNECHKMFSAKNTLKRHILELHKN